jgi:SUMO ligase MMS21 Smc5/6 complex component
MPSHNDRPRKSLYLVCLPHTSLILTYLKRIISSLCGHSFSRDAIQQYLGPNKASIRKCPASGCNKSFCWNDLKTNKDLEKRVKAAGRRRRAQEEDEDDDDEVIE